MNYNDIFFQAIKNSNCEQLEQLFKSGKIDIEKINDYKNEDGDTGLMVAVKHANNDTIKYLILHGANPGLRNCNGESVRGVVIKNPTLQHWYDTIEDAVEQYELIQKVKPKCLELNSKDIYDQLTYSKTSLHKILDAFEGDLSPLVERMTYMDAMLAFEELDQDIKFSPQAAESFKQVITDKVISSMTEKKGQPYFLSLSSEELYNKIVNPVANAGEKSAFQEIKDSFGDDLPYLINRMSFNHIVEAYKHLGSNKKLSLEEDNMFRFVIAEKSKDVFFQQEGKNDSKTAAEQTNGMKLFVKNYRYAFER